MSIRKMKIVLSCICVLSIVSCTAEITNQEIENAISVCKDNKGLTRITSLQYPAGIIHCLNDVTFPLVRE